jgi:hypothetical protein
MGVLKPTKGKVKAQSRRKKLKASLEGSIVFSSPILNTPCRACQCTVIKSKIYLLN